jgi:hypothetical protein
MLTMRRWGWVWVGLLLSGGCAAESTPANTPANVDASPIESVESSACYQPPWLPKALPPAVRVSECKEEERVFRFVLGSGKPATDDEENDFLNAHRWEFHAIEGIVGSGHGLCCFEDSAAPNTLCVAFDLRLCSTSLPEFVNAVRAIHANDAKLADRALRISVRLEGLTGPRCAKGEPECGPLPYTEKNTRPAPQVRMPVDPVDTETEPCTYDGECVANGCGNECDHWTLGGAAGTCPFILKLENAYCGCVAERCAWFE